MTNEEKAKEIALNTVGERIRNHPSNILHIICVKDACIEMARWKDRELLKVLQDKVTELSNDLLSEDYTICP